ncbi:hypothetical protein J1N35_030403 [Gossypium stocksii]|uniref:Uncharacterized protein n=1 Tax=Gossypium stocksii TaxID=47602 RepID=A0A9D3UZN3_9ROSI|nr:hypothetical protein J1N35_030403 [Gossypium stocksii]
MRLVESTVEPSPLGKVDCVSDFNGKEAMQKQLKRVNVPSKESSLLGVKVDLGEFGANGSPKAARIARLKI